MFRVITSLDMSEGERAYLQDMRGLTTDLDGNEIMVGLTLEESRWYLDYLHAEYPIGGGYVEVHHSSADRDRYIDLHDRYERARFEVLAAERARRFPDVTVN